MIRYQRLTGVSLSGAAPGPVVPVTPEGQAMAGTPGWAMFMDPAHVAGTNVRNRARRDSFLTGANLPLAAVGGNPVFAPADGDTMRHRSMDVGMNPDTWTVFAVCKPAAGTSTQRIVGMQAADTPPLGQVTPRIGFSVSGDIAQIQGSGAAGGMRLSYASDYTTRAGLTLLMFTFSTRDGLRIFDNGAQVAAAPSDTAPLTDSFGPGEIDCFRFCRGSYGMTGVLDIDLGWMEHAGYRRRIDTFLMAKYGIT